MRRLILLLLALMLVTSCGTVEACDMTTKRECGEIMTIDNDVISDDLPAFELAIDTCAITSDIEMRDDLLLGSTKIVQVNDESSGTIESQLAISNERQVLPEKNLRVILKWPLQTTSFFSDLAHSSTTRAWDINPREKPMA